VSPRARGELQGSSVDIAAVVYFTLGAQRDPGEHPVDHRQPEVPSAFIAAVAEALMIGAG
jgi:hypothetical protein